MSFLQKIRNVVSGSKEKIQISCDRKEYFGGENIRGYIRVVGISSDNLDLNIIKSISCTVKGKEKTGWEVTPEINKNDTLTERMNPKHSAADKLYETYMGHYTFLEFDVETLEAKTEDSDIVIPVSRIRRYKNLEKETVVSIESILFFCILHFGLLNLQNKTECL
eukprot:TRINITY_DN4374_c0_g1_i2.p1 TRINITY_DN4374_c0_g1~~TRINITY_DN4374_c0_g1_i2.p1  ORF type:complete len:165 (+),score=12.92 TRINITY_DN4374_c0_g1_i2:84-578(+)